MNMNRAVNTVFGGLGFIGSYLCQSFEKDGLPYQIVNRQDSLPTGYLGNVFYCAGVTADFRSRPFDTMDAHISTLSKVLKQCQYTSLLYLSSARIYRHAPSTTEDSKFTVCPQDPEDLVDLSKLAGEALCLSMNNEKVRIVRLSNVFGKDFTSDMFLTEMIKSALLKREINLQSALNSSKDFIDVKSVVNMMRCISDKGTHRIYNVASGYNVSHKEIVCKLQDVTGCSLMIADDASSIIWSLINIDLIKQEFDFKPICLTDKLEELVSEYREYYGL
jgi:nucleoside-diphosphate-sugar epimerase